MYYIIDKYDKIWIELQEYLLRIILIKMYILFHICEFRLRLKSPKIKSFEILV